MKILILYASLLVLCHCGEIPFTDEDTPTIKPKITGEETEPDSLQTETVPSLPESNPDVPIITENKEEQTAEEILQEETPPEEPPFSEEEITLISEDLELTEDTVIKNRKVILDMAQIKTHEHSLFIIAEEFHSNHSVIQNFPEGRKAKKKEHGKNGGNILIEAEKAIGELQLVLNGEKGGRVPRRSKISKDERKRLKGKNGRNGRDAVYKRVCRTVHVPLSLNPIGIPVFPRSVPIRNCWDECDRSPKREKNGKRGKRGIPGFDGKNGGDSGSFHLKAFELSDFHLVNIQKIPGEASKGSKGSHGGYGGDRGRNGRDRKGLCNRRLSRPKSGDEGRRGRKGKNGRDGNEGAVCLEKLVKTEGPETTQVSLETPVAEKENVICY